MDLKKLTQDKNLTETERQVLQYILTHLDSALTRGVRDIARANYTSTSTIMRLAHKMGYTGFVDMCYKLGTVTQEQNQQLGNAQTFLNGFNLESLLSYITYDQIKAFAEKLAEAEGTMVFVYATGFSGLMGSYLASKLTNMGKLCLYANAGDSGGIFENALPTMKIFVCISKSGKTKQVFDKIKTAKENGAFTVAITGEKENSISKYADIWFRVKDTCKLDDQNINPNTFFPQTLMLIEILAYEYQRICTREEERKEASKPEEA